MTANLNECKEYAKKLGLTIKTNKNTIEKYQLFEGTNPIFWASNIDALKAALLVKIYESGRQP